MFSHVTLGTNDLRRAEDFFDAVLLPLGLVKRMVEPDGGPRSLCWVGKDNTLPRFYVYQPFDGKVASSGNGTMIAFEAPSEFAVNEAFNAGLSLGGTDEGSPRQRAHYGRGYYGSYLRDLDGNKIHIVFRGDI